MPRKPGWTPPDSSLEQEAKSLGEFLRAITTVGIYHPEDFLQYPELHPDLFPYQREGIEWLRRNPNCILSDEMGLGKTTQILHALPLNAPVIIFCPLGVVDVWGREIKLWTPSRPFEIIRDAKKMRFPLPGETIITNIDKIWARQAEYKWEISKGQKVPRPLLERELPSLSPATHLILDECHVVKGDSATTLRVKRWRALETAVKLSHGFSLGITGTPMLNSKRELVNLLRSFGLFDKVFPEGFLKAKKLLDLDNKWTCPHPSVKERLKAVMLRRTRAEVFPQMPAKQYRHIGVKVPKQLGKDMDAIWEKLQKYRLDTLEDFMSALWAVGGIEVFSLIRAALASAKIPTLLGLVETYEDEEEPLVVCSAYRAPVDALGSRKGWGTITGSVTGESRGKVEDDFREGNLQGVAFTIRAGGVGISLTRATNMILNDLEWSPELVLQAEDRLRPHLQKRSCLYTYLVAEHPMEEHLMYLLALKRRLIASVI